MKFYSYMDAYHWKVELSHLIKFTEMNIPNVIRLIDHSLYLHDPLTSKRYWMHTPQSLILLLEYVDGIDLAQSTRIILDSNPFGRTNRAIDLITKFMVCTLYVRRLYIVRTYPIYTFVRHST